MTTIHPAASPAAVAAPSPVTPAMRRAAQDFEAQALGALLQPMFEGLGSGGAFGGGAGEAQWRPMLVAEFGTALARSGGVGLADQVLAAMRRAAEGAS